MNKYKFWNSYHLKLIAIIAMTVDHVGAVFFKNANVWLYLFMRSVGAITFPIMAYMISQGYIYTRNLKKYKMRLVWFAVLSMIPYAAAFGRHTYGLNVGFTLLGGLLSIEIYDKIENPFLKWSAILAISFLSFKCDWGFCGVWLIVLFYLSDKNKVKIFLSVTAAVILFLIKNQAEFFVMHGRFISASSVIRNTAFLRLSGFFVSALMICGYNRTKGKNKKMIFYIYYPIHLLALAAFANIICN